MIIQCMFYGFFTLFHLEETIKSIQRIAIEPCYGSLALSCVTELRHIWSRLHVHRLEMEEPIPDAPEVDGPEKRLDNIETRLDYDHCDIMAHRKRLDDIETRLGELEYWRPARVEKASEKPLDPMRPIEPGPPRGEACFPPASGEAADAG